MSLILMQLGQCGNQLGEQLYSTLANDIKSHSNNENKQISSYVAESENKFFRRTKNNNLIARSVLVDMEPKVISHATENARRGGVWLYDTNNTFCRSRGSANNWAYGYHTHGPEHSADVMELARREAERADGLAGFLCVMSLAGGTGSGVGTRVTEALRTDFPHSFIVNAVVTPYSTGEVIVQSYNSLLSVAHLYGAADALLVLENDVLHRICAQLLHVKHVSFTDLNAVAAHQMASVLQPTDSGAPRRRAHLGDMLEHLVAHPQYKLLTLRCTPQTSEHARQFSADQWPGLLKHLRQMLIADSPLDAGINWQIAARSRSDYFNKSVANLLFLRGPQSDSVTSVGLEEAHLYPRWLPAGAGLQTWTHPCSLNQYEKMATLLSNSQSPVSALNLSTDRAWRMFSARAYVHQYVRHGMEEADFLDCFACLEQVIASYQRL